MPVCYLMFGVIACPEVGLPHPSQPYIVRDLEKGTDTVHNIQYWRLPEKYYKPDIRVFIRRD
jgi:hypothetical protein